MARACKPTISRANVSRTGRAPGLCSCVRVVTGWGTAFGSHRSVQTETTRVPITCLTARNRSTSRSFASDRRVSLGNEFNKHTDKDAEGTLEAAWEVGVRYFDVAPWYGFGLAERRFGHFLHNKNAKTICFPPKSGKLFKALKNNRHTEIYPLSDTPNDIVFDYTADGVRRSIEDSLQRLGVDSLDVAFVHDISPDFAYFPSGWEEQYEIARKGAFPALSKMRDEGIIRAWGIGVNTPQPILKVMDDADPDVCLCARQYSLIDHANAVNELFPAVPQEEHLTRHRVFRAQWRLHIRKPAIQLRQGKFQDPCGRDRKARKTANGSRSLWRGSTNRCASILGSARCRGRSCRRGAKPSADRRGLQFAARQNPLRILGPSLNSEL